MSNTDPRQSIAFRIAASGGVVIVLVMLALCVAMAVTTSRQTRAEVRHSARAEAATLAQSVDAFDTASRQVAERFYQSFADNFQGAFALDAAAGTLTHQGEALNGNFAAVDRFLAQTGGVATVFARKGDDFVRVTTSLKKENGERAMGTMLGAKHPAFAALTAGQSYTGRAVLFGKPYMTRYQAVKDAGGQVVGILFIGFDVSSLQATLEKLVADGRLYDSGGLAVIDPRQDLSEAQFVAHPSARGRKVVEAVPGAQATLAALRDAGDAAVDLAVPLLAPGGDRWAVVQKSRLTGWWVVAEVADGEAMREHTRTTWIFAVLFALATAVLATGLAWTVRRDVARPLQALERSLATVAEGDLTQSVAVGRQDEIGRLAGQAEAMREHLAAIIEQVREATASIRTASADVAKGNAELSQRTDSAAVSLERTASSMDELTGSVRQSADAAAQADQLAQAASSVATRGGDVVSRVVSTMDEISNASRRIADIIGTIDGIAFQTNILALNAAVEAARAGEQGRGFAVVAGEVRSLAQRSATAAREIKALIGDSVDKVDAGARLVQGAGGTMTEIVDSVRRVTGIIGEISHAAAEQSAGIGQVNQAVEHLDQVTHQNAALVEQSAAAARSMSDEAQRLATLVQQFRTGRG